MVLHRVLLSHMQYSYSTVLKKRKCILKEIKSRTHYIFLFCTLTYE